MSLCVSVTDNGLGVRAATHIARVLPNCRLVYQSDARRFVQHDVVGKEGRSLSRNTHTDIVKVVRIQAIVRGFQARVHVLRLREVTPGM